ncbi:MAG: GntR family transcriptional regulator [Planctomycetota bacterium]
MLTIQLDSDVPIADQIVRGIRSAIALGEVEPGDELPPVRQLARDLGINLNTVARAYRSLEARGLVHTARGRGTRVLADLEPSPESAAQTSRRVREALRFGLTDAKLAGLNRASIARLLEEELARFWPRPRVRRR